MKKSIKKLENLLVFMLTFIFAFSSLTVAVSDTAYAAEDNDAYITYNKEIYDNNKELCDRLAEGMSNFSEQIYVGDFKISKKEIMRYIIKTVIRKHPELFYVNPTQYMFGSNGTYIAVICPIYLYDKQTAQEKIDVFNAECDKYIAKTDDSMTEFEKAVVLHDQLVLNCKYVDDDDLLYVSAYESIVNGNANCQGYAEAYSYLLSRVGVYSEIVESSAMYHLWNKVRIGNEYYNVDLTWDDPMPDKTGHVSHKYFLLSDSAISSGNDEISAHYGFDYAYYKSENTKYDKRLFREFNTQFCFVDNECYVIDNKYQSKYEKCLLKYNTNTDVATIVKQFDFTWKSDDTSYWKGGYMSLDESDGLLYFNSPNCIYSYSVASNTMSEFAHTDAYSGDCYGLRIDDGVVYAAVSLNPNVENTIVNSGNCVKDTVNIFHELLYVYGDVNGDGIVNIVDASCIQKYVTGEDNLTDEQLMFADYNKDGEVNIIDVTEIQKSKIS